MVNQEIMKKIAQAIVEESAQLDGVQPEEMLREVATSLNGEDGRPYHGVGEVVAHRGVQITEEIVRNITVAVVKEAAELDGVNPEEMVQKVIGALQGQSVTPVAPITNDSAIMKQRGVAVDMDVAKTVTEAVLKESAEHVQHFIFSPCSCIVRKLFPWAALKEFFNCFKIFRSIGNTWN